MQNNKVVATLKADGTVYPSNVNIYGSNSVYNNNSVYCHKRNDPMLTNGNGRSAILAPPNNTDVSKLPQLPNGPSTSGAATNVVDLGKQMLQYARVGDLIGVKSMLMRGAPFTCDWLGMSPLHFAAMKNYYEICDVLLKGGINRDWRTKVDRTPLHLATFNGHERIVELLLSRKCGVNVRDMLKMTPLHWAVQRGHKGIVRMLLKYQADVTLQSKFGQTAIALAVIGELPDLLEELQAAKEAQLSQKFNEETEKETSDAVNSIMGMQDDAMGVDAIDCNDAMMEVDLNSGPDNEIVERSDGSKALNETPAINLLKNHGIAMMKDDGDDSKVMLNTALKNGRKLVLSEGGKLLLNDTKQTPSQCKDNILVPPKPKNMINTNNSNNSNNNNGNVILLRDLQRQHGFLGGNVRKATVPLKPALKSNTPANTMATSGIIRKDVTVVQNGAVNKSKKVRIISLNDFKKLYGNNVKGVHKMPPSLASSTAVKQIAKDAKQTNGSTAARKYFLPPGMRTVTVNSEQQKIQNEIQKKYQEQQKEHEEKLYALLDSVTDDFTDLIQTVNDETEPDYDLRPFVTSKSSGPITVNAASSFPMKTQFVAAAAAAASTGSASLDFNSNSAPMTLSQPTPTPPTQPQPQPQTTKILPSTVKAVGAGNSTKSLVGYTTIANPARKSNLINQPATKPASVLTVNTSNGGAGGTVKTATTTTTMPNKRVEPVMRFRQLPATMTTAQQPNASSQPNRIAITTMNANGDKKTTYIPLLTVPELSHQMFEMRKQHEEMRRKLESAQREKEALRKRLERLEQLLLIDQTQGDYTVS